MGRRGARKASFTLQENSYGSIVFPAKREVVRVIMNVSQIDPLLATIIASQQITLAVV
jgi:hypothetical protein